MGHVYRGAVRVLCVLITARVAQAAPGDLADLPETRLADIVVVAVRQSPDLARARLDLDAARAQLTRAQGSEDTHVGLQAETSVVIAGEDDPTGDQDTEIGALSVSRPLSTGGTLSAATTAERVSQIGTTQDAQGHVTATRFSRYSTVFALRLVQPLLRGAGSDAFEAPIRQAERQRDAAALTSEARARDLLTSLTQAYWQVAFAWRQLEIRKASLELGQQQL